MSFFANTGFLDELVLTKQMAHFDFFYAMGKQTLAKTLMSHKPELTPQLCEEQVRLGAVYVNQRREQNPLAMVEAGDLIRHHHHPKRYTAHLPVLASVQSITFADRFVFVWKPHGLPSHPTLDNAEENAKRLCERLLQIQKLYSLNRLDQGTAGWLAFATSSVDAKSYFAWSEQGMIEKHYQAITCGTERFPNQELNYENLIHYQRRTKTVPKIVCDPSVDPGSSLKMITQVRSWEPLVDGMHLWHLQLKTGRTHQIRLQLSAIGAPILGDTMYGAKAVAHYTGFALECDQLVIEPLGLALKRPRVEQSLSSKFSPERA